MMQIALIPLLRRYNRDLPEFRTTHKLKGLALYAETHAKAYRRIESVAEVKGKLRKLDLKNEDVRKGIADATDAQSLFIGGVARDY